MGLSCHRWTAGMNESGRRVDRPATRVTHARQHGGDILRKQERSNSANVVFKTAPSGLLLDIDPSISDAAVRAGWHNAWPFLWAAEE
jgi:hypothetical protein